MVISSNFFGKFLGLNGLSLMFPQKSAEKKEKNERAGTLTVRYSVHKHSRLMFMVY
jgi:hypothetical protein